MANIIEITTVTVFGTSKAANSDAAFELAESLGRLLAENGFTLANGGYGGTMLAGAKGLAKGVGTLARTGVRGAQKGGVPGAATNMRRMGNKQVGQAADWAKKNRGAAAGLAGAGLVGAYAAG